MVSILCRYNGGCHGYGNMENYCSHCGEVLYEQVCDENGIPTGEVLGLREGQTMEDADREHMMGDCEDYPYMKP